MGGDESSTAGRIETPDMLNILTTAVLLLDSHHDKHGRKEKERLYMPRCLSGLHFTCFHTLLSPSPKNSSHLDTKLG